MDTRGDWLRFFGMLFSVAWLSACGGGGGGVTDDDGDGWLPPADCDDHNSGVHPGAREIPYNSVDEDCDGIANNDADLDGFDDAAQAGGDDCDDSNRSIHPGAPEIPYDGVDQNCNGMDDEYDIDADGHKAKMFAGDDCCDSGLELWLGCAGATAARMHPGATETVGNGIDENCDGSDTVATAVEGDSDGDGYAANSRPEGMDCDDTDASIYPGAPEICDGKDNDCDSQIDEDSIDIDDDFSMICFDCDDYDGRRSPDFEEIPYNDVDENCDGVAVNDVDGDGFWPIVDPQDPDRPLDCNDNDPNIHPNATEVCDGRDNDCEGGVDEDFAGTNPDGDGDGWLGGGGCPDCDDANAGINPAAVEIVYDGIDQNCNGMGDEYDADHDGHNAQDQGGDDCCDRGDENVFLCSPATAPTMYPGAQDIPNDGIDQDCSGTDLIDTDIDRDGHESALSGGDDCDDSNPNIHSGHQEDCSDLLDNDCSGLINEGCGPGTGEEVQIPAGPFTMGSDHTGWSDQTPAHVVELSAYAIDKYEVTVADYLRCVAAGGCLPPPEIYSVMDEGYFHNQQKGLYPAIWISHSRAERYCAWVGKRLPTEAEWEKAARGAGSSTWAYPWGDIEYTTAPDGSRVRKPVECTRANHAHLWTRQPCVGDPEPVDAYPQGASIFGVFNMAGNVSEWVSDWYDERYYETSPQQNPTGPAGGSFKVIRGGGFLDVDFLIEVTFRDSGQTFSGSVESGFRCARSLP